LVMVATTDFKRKQIQKKKKEKKNITAVIKLLFPVSVQKAH